MNDPTELTPLAETIRGISLAISGSYPDGLDAEAHTWRRCLKVAEESGEVFAALSGMLGENPRKGVTHTSDDVIMELLDVAGAALGAVSYMTQERGDPLALLADRLTHVLGRLR